jgi:hypothetical protein
VQATIDVLATLRGQLAKNELERRVLLAHIEQMEAEFLSHLSGYLPDSGFLTLDEKEVARSSKIKAIKMVRDRTHLGLKDSKDKVDEFLAADKVRTDAIAAQAVKRVAEESAEAVRNDADNVYGERYRCGDEDCACAE